MRIGVRLDTRGTYGALVEEARVLHARDAAEAAGAHRPEDRPPAAPPPFAARALTALAHRHTTGKLVLVP
ncbi:hypothetical protein GL263_26065 [Streptomyces durbertensis]|uniref:Zinc-binding dehydrogenase n=1 Tax=Streptomyces durbertensis TaxID=2448886 RepID=A0ABR6ENQ6_9ACTN|nr:hypothetical protein [Streptomyces durbertensis]MBB1246984.1 hypothetical protein [Streptomyces durbertensis]